MKISYNWVKDYLKINIEASRVARILTGIGLEIEGMEEWISVKGGLEGVVIGEVITCRKHPDADQLSVTTVDVGGPRPLQIVCGAPNVAAGQKVPVATVGTTVFRGNDSLEIKKSKIRGELSEGMICAEDELGLGDDHEGIMVLSRDAKPGTPAGSYFKITRDTVFEIGLTPNRIDSGSHFGVARDLAAYLNLNEGLKEKAILPDISGFKYDNKNNVYEVIIENPADCPRYSGITISGITVGESPQWLKDKLRAVGLNPINNVVDITNFVQHEIGQPLHAFDADKIDGKKVIIRNLPDKSKFITLDSVDRNLSSRDLMICNTNEGMCIAGVFGGIKSGVSASTINIFLESAYFNPVSIRKTSRRHGLKTDASYRFERGADPEITTWALKRAAILIKEIAGGEITSDIVDIYPVPLKKAEVKINYNNITRLIGKKIEQPVIKEILSLLDINIKEENRDDLVVEIPTRRVDVKKEADVIEEILRIYGYNNVEISNHVNSTITYSEKPDKEKLVNIISDMLAANGFAEIMCNSLSPAAWYEQNEDFDKSHLVHLANPLSSDLNVMRQSLLYGGLSSVIWNINRQNPDLRLFEFGHCYFCKNPVDTHPTPGHYFEQEHLDLFITGSAGKQSWNSKTNPTDFFHIKSFVEMVFTRMGLKPETLVERESDKKYFSESVAYIHNNKIVAEAGRISRKYLSQFDIGQDVYYGNIEWDLMLKIARNNTISFHELPKYPSVRRDLALLLDRGIKFSQIRQIALKTERNILQDISLFDVYESDSLGKNKKSYAVSFILRDDLKTLTDKNIDKVMNNLVSAFEKELNAHIR
ncbi:MAG: phenylalanine--tRNA ligase subunit beta [Bacteroidetes bacterium GWE2_41_25]|nr:MAG: phenylalanine--tRNA ligase subunit beta [Bacteroidetes bacterium GWA2_40_15]OFX91943.1 MAG: phenylalanine--tRNA ligase subunit beta [Bacteroidetes bacterium GWE2_41_25]OFX95656.1 MAG: phenylalanine--tRNA ligase subunit beta [Bacteroidetes bacterium GWC2_40_22]OFY58098.1 MAG: phenylalanine--tRNA ligase subunit beta [Bacteroidetes bacterium GWF2_41_9]HBH83255.1 phenylalanine--tRNA ligase subunit beta [Bacteroidales bacterium]